jgi:hypothetical protein
MWSTGKKSGAMHERCRRAQLPCEDLVMDHRLFSSLSRRPRGGVAPNAKTLADRRSVLKVLAAGGVAIPATYLLGAVPSVGLLSPAWAAPAIAPAAPSALRAASPASLSNLRPVGAIARDFSDPVLELRRLLREAAEIEHGLMLEYISAALSLKPQYESVAGYGAPQATDLLGVAVQEMQHLGAVNRMLIALGAAPQLTPLEFPLEPEIYPFDLALEPLSRESAARYTYCEAPIGLFDGRPESSADAALASAIVGAVGPHKRPNSVGLLYATVIDITSEIVRTPQPGLPEMGPWIDQLRHIKTEGEDDHFAFFKSLFLGTHAGFAGQADVWSLAKTDPNYPAYVLPTNPSAYIGHEHQLGDPTTMALAWLGNLQYWTTLSLLDQHFRHKAQVYRELAVGHMMGGVLSIGRHLPTLGAAMPFDAMNLPYSSGTDPRDGVRLIVALLQEGHMVAEAIEKSLPSDYPLTLNRDTMAQLEALVVGDKGASL